MKLLQRNFTTPEQSKRLLELGVPADSADCYYDQYRILQYRTIDDYGYDFFGLNFRFIPCWSVGRLMGIFAICFDPDFIHFDTFADGINFLKQMMDKFETYAENMDFSKLEEGV
jgi:hypothetical protein